MLHVPLNIGEHNNLNDDVQTVKRRSRSRKPRNKRRNTIAGTDQREIEEAVRGYVYRFSFFLSISKSTCKCKFTLCTWNCNFTVQMPSGRQWVVHNIMIA